MQLETGLLGPTCRRLGKLQGSELLNGGGISSAPKVIFCEALLTFSAFSVKCLWRCVVNYGQRRSLTSKTHPIEVETAPTNFWQLVFISVSFPPPFSSRGKRWSRFKR